MQGNSERYSCHAVADWTGENDAQEGAGRPAVVAPCRKAPQTSDALPQCNGGRVSIEYFQHRQAIHLGVPHGKKGSRYEPAVKDPARLESRPGEELPRVFAVEVPVRQDH